MSLLQLYYFLKFPIDELMRNWISTTCRDIYIQTAIIKTCAYNNRFALKCAFGESYNDLYPGTIYSPPSYDAHFPSAIMSS